ncbi:MAG: hypothetical protein DHS20C21_03990 [Gemmatimonadota bacterium]|nr:MAG: hypothetical protein DHS20C21_03990 [Gemmatimonadota bacterium]
MIQLPTFAAAALGLVVTASAVAAEWTAVAPMPGLGRHHPATFSIDGYGYVVSGTTTGAASTKDFFRYDPVADAWTVLPDFPGAARSYAYAKAYNGKGYFGFGAAGPYFRDLWEYDPVSSTWTQLADCPGLGRAHPAFVMTDNGKLFVGAGNAAQNMKDWWEYDVATNVWTQRADLPGPVRHHPYHFNIGNDAYLCFGHGASIYKDVYRWDQDTVSWTQLTDLPARGRVAGTEFSYDGRGYVLSGENDNHTQFAKGQFWGYEPDTDTWTRLTNHPGSSRWAPGSFVVGEYVYMMGGLSTSALEGDMWRFPMSSVTDVRVVPPTSDIVFEIYPNPLSGVQFQLFDPDGVYETASARLFDVTGRQVADLRGDSYTLQIPDGISAGRYFVSLGTKSGDRVTRPITLLR